jgi:hypothetical protein
VSLCEVDVGDLMVAVGKRERLDLWRMSVGKKRLVVTVTCLSDLQCAVTLGIQVVDNI